MPRALVLTVAAAVRKGRRLVGSMVEKGVGRREVTVISNI
jgi:hypothetical protein